MSDNELAQAWASVNPGVRHYTPSDQGGGRICYYIQWNWAHEVAPVEIWLNETIPHHKRSVKALDRHLRRLALKEAREELVYARARLARAGKRCELAAILQEVES